MPYVQTQGPTTILVASGKSSNTTGTTAIAGSWYQIHPKLGRFYFTCQLTGTSAVSTATATVNIEASNDGVTAASTPIYSFSGITLTTDTVVLGGSPPSTLAGQWGYLRANLTSLTTATAGSSGSPAGTNSIVRVIMNGGYVGY